mmetsp:Transcript_27891/g.63862  ORF Transcript_27891/g.63862 Transcript_27891/m.63862 type:complete len:271 (+) Transcript_27891:439-1251(+)
MGKNSPCLKAMRGKRSARTCLMKSTVPLLECFVENVSKRCPSPISEETGSCRCILHKKRQSLRTSTASETAAIRREISSACGTCTTRLSRVVVPATFCWEDAGKTRLCPTPPSSPNKKTSSCPDRPTEPSCCGTCRPRTTDPITAVLAPTTSRQYAGVPFVRTTICGRIPRVSKITNATTTRRRRGGAISLPSWGWRSCGKVTVRTLGTSYRRTAGVSSRSGTCTWRCPTRPASAAVGKFVYKLSILFGQRANFLLPRRRFPVMEMGTGR